MACASGLSCYPSLAGIFMNTPTSVAYVLINYFFRNCPWGFSFYVEQIRIIPYDIVTTEWLLCWKALKTLDFPALSFADTIQTHLLFKCSLNPIFLWFLLLAPSYADRDILLKLKNQFFYFFLCFLCPAAFQCITNLPEDGLTDALQILRK